MSFYTEFPNEHDLNTALAILDMKKGHSELQLVAADGGYPFKDIIVPDTPIILGYKPDAICSNYEVVHLLETKSFNDLTSAHSKKQYKIINSVMSNIPSSFFNLYVFGRGNIPYHFIYDHFESLLEKVVIKKFYEGGIID